MKPLLAISNAGKLSPTTWALFFTERPQHGVNVTLAVFILPRAQLFKSLLHLRCRTHCTITPSTPTSPLLPVTALPALWQQGLVSSSQFLWYLIAVFVRREYIRKAYLHLITNIYSDTCLPCFINFKVEMSSQSKLTIKISLWLYCTRSHFRRLSSSKGVSSASKWQWEKEMKDLATGHVTWHLGIR